MLQASNNVYGESVDPGELNISTAENNAMKEAGTLNTRKSVFDVFMNVRIASSFLIFYYGNRVS